MSTYWLLDKPPQHLTQDNLSSTYRNILLAVQLSFIDQTHFACNLIKLFRMGSYFKDPNGHLIEYLTMLDDKVRRPDLGIVSWSEWIALNR